MTLSSNTTLIAQTGRPARSKHQRRDYLASGLFTAPYVILLLMFGVVPVVYTLILAVSKAEGSFAGIENFVTALSDFRFLPSITNIGKYLVIWLLALVVIVVGLALLLHQKAATRTAKSARFIYYIPGALAGAASVLVWLFMLSPTVSPVEFLFDGLGLSTFQEVIAPRRLAAIFALIAFWTGAGGWILIMQGALNSVPHELIEAARVDGANPFRIAWQIQIPLVTKWIAYMLIMCFATGTQLFVEPQLLASASFGGVNEAWSPNQLALIYAFQYGDFNAAAALNVVLLAVSLLLALFVIKKVKFFDTE